MCRDTNRTEVLVIDNDLDFATTVANLISERYNIGCKPVDKIDEVMDVMKYSVIKVAVIDQVMPEIKGTELFRIMKKVSPGVKAIMLTGEATKEDIGDAVNLGFDKYHEKKDVLKLPEVVLDLYAKYDIDNKKQNKEKLLFRDKKYMFIPCSLYYLASIDRIENSVTFDKEWKTRISLNVGEELELEHSVEYDDTIVFSEEKEGSLKGSFGLDSLKNSSLRMAINSELKNRYTGQFSVSKKSQQKSKKKYSLPSGPVSSDSSRIIKRNIETTPVYIEYKIIIRKKCWLCGASEMIPAIIYKRSNRIMTRQCDFLDDGSQKITNTGEEKL